jgi:DeoR/GlpR family transcriptional regulator of sugar metabolism
VLAAAPNRTLRELAAEFGVSHETIRAVLRDRSSDATVVAPGTVTQKR